MLRGRPEGNYLFKLLRESFVSIFPTWCCSSREIEAGVLVGKSRAPDWEFILTFVQFSHQRAFNASLLTYQTAKLPGTIDGNMLP